MTDDLVKRLRESCYVAFDDGTNDYSTAIESADRIEKLQAALRLILDNDRNLHRPLEELFAEFCIEARAALGEKKDD